MMSIDIYSGPEGIEKSATSYGCGRSGFRNRHLDASALLVSNKLISGESQAQHFDASSLAGLAAFEFPVWPP